MAQPLTLEILDQLIGFDTTSCNSNLQLMAYVQGYLENLGVTSQLIYDAEEKKANLYATIGPQDKAGVMLSGHTDTVPVAGQNWTRQPYQLTEENGYYYGRGTTDMKGFIAVVLAAVPQMINQTLHTPIHLAFSYDEEIGCVGVRRLIHTMQNQPLKPAICIIGEPTSMQVVTAHKGKLAAKVTVTGKECHSGMAPLGVNAVNYAARMIIWLEQLAQNKEDFGPFEEGYDIPHSTVHTGTVKGGTALNIVPNHCEFLFEIRNIAQEDPRDLLAQFENYAEELLAEMRLTDQNCDIAIEITTEYPGLSTAEDAEVVAFVKKLAQSTANANINFGTEGGLFSNVLGIPTVVCGPGNMDQGHKPDEFIHNSQLQQCEAFMARLINELSTSTSQGG
ncbi:acetylornithine deacetylase [Amphritea balenae]|uniref:Acetylornithine deacetylase n=1 Tax=Amphritea balenae TaxID=452629 RepID=A0A3P1SYC8_9GAMM|nr:acetylornithine deacetylase [Amphritea balenae]RRD01556.1 acetylornithine deacetylase [Amphritea balenae]GGK55940.1 acetylornithine deacetylase [Amphritea balenae]